MNNQQAGLLLCTQIRVTSMQPSNMTYASLLMGVFGMYMKWYSYALQFI